MFRAKLFLLFLILSIVNCNDDDDYIQNEENNVEEFNHISVSSIIVSPYICQDNYRWIRGQCREII